MQWVNVASAANLLNWASGGDAQKVFCQPDARCGEIRQLPSSFAERRAALAIGAL